MMPATFEQVSLESLTVRSVPVTVLLRYSSQFVFRVEHGLELPKHGNTSLMIMAPSPACSRRQDLILLLLETQLAEDVRAAFSV